MRDQILAVEDLAEEIVDVPEWDARFLVREMDAEQLTAFRLASYQASLESKSDAYALALAVRFSTCDPASGEPVFRKGDEAKLVKKSGKALERLSDVALRLSGFEEEESDPKDGSAPTRP
jgi:hypothetical protein